MLNKFICQGCVTSVRRIDYFRYAQYANFSPTLCITKWPYSWPLVAKEYVGGSFCMILPMSRIYRCTVEERRPIFIVHAQSMIRQTLVELCATVEKPAHGVCAFPNRLRVCVAHTSPLGLRVLIRMQYTSIMCCALNCEMILSKVSPMACVDSLRLFGEQHRTLNILPCSTYDCLINQ